jgi:hypothetical protein
MAFSLRVENRTYRLTPKPSTHGLQPFPKKDGGRDRSRPPQIGWRQPTCITTLPLEPGAETDGPRRLERVDIRAAAEERLAEIGVPHQQV